MSNLPFAGGGAWANLFKATGNIVDLARMTEADEHRYYTAIADFVERDSSLIPKANAELISEKMPGILDKLTTNATFSQWPGGRFWYATMMVAKLGFPDRHAVGWNKLFRSLGIDGVVDPGIGIIHNSEPHQAVFFSINAIAANERVANKYSPQAVNAAISRGAERKAAIAPGSGRAGS